MQISRRSFLANSLVTGAALLDLPSQVSAQTPYPEIFGIDALRYYASKKWEEYSPRLNFTNEDKKPIIFDQQIEDIGRVSLTVKQLVGNLDLEMRIYESQDGLEFQHFRDSWIKGYLGPEDFVEIHKKVDRGKEIAYWHGSGHYWLIHYRPFREGEHREPIDYHGFKEGEAQFDFVDNSFKFDGIYKVPEGQILKRHQELLRRNKQEFQDTNERYRPILQFIILELEKQGKLELTR